MHIYKKSNFPSDRYLCPERLIEGNPILEVIINPHVGKVKVLSTPDQFLTYCDTTCTNKDSCTQQTQQAILDTIHTFERNKVPHK